MSEAIRRALQDAYKLIDPTIDVYKGPIYDQFIRPQSLVLGRLENEQDRTDRLASSDFTAAATDVELTRMAASMGSGTPAGTVSTGYAYFGTRSRPRPGTSITIPKGALVSDSSVRYVYQVVESGTIDGDNADGYYNSNPAKRTYEIRLPIQAVSVGDGYNLPPLRITNVLSKSVAVDFVENREYTSGGTNPGNRDAILARVARKLKGQTIGTIGGLTEAVSQVASVGNVQLVTSADPVLFRRLVDKSGVDVYYSGELATESTYTFTAIGGELSTRLPYSPVLSVQSVSVNGVAVPYNFVLDSNAATSGSLLDTSMVEFSSPLSAGSRVIIGFKYDAVASMVSERFTGANGIFGADMLARRSFRVTPVVSLYGDSDSSFNPFALRTSIITSVTQWFETQTFGSTYFPSDLIEYVWKSIAGLRQRPKIAVFHLSERSFNEVEPIVLHLNETARIQPALLTVNVK